MSELGLGLVVLLFSAELPAEEQVGPRLDFIDEICSYNWLGDVWGCDTDRLGRVPEERIRVDSGLVPHQVRELRYALGADGTPALLEPEERGQDPTTWGPKPLWACISGVEIHPLPQRGEQAGAGGPAIKWGEARWVVDGRPLQGVVDPTDDVGGTRIRTAAPPCVGPRLFFQSDKRLEISLRLPYEIDGETSELSWSYVLERKGVSEDLAMTTATPPRRWRGRVPEPPDEKTVVAVAPIGICLGAVASGIGLAATFGGAAIAGPDPGALVYASAAAAMLPLLAGVVLDATFFALWIYEGIEHFRYDIALGTLRHWDRSRAAYEKRMQELGLAVPVDY